MRRGRQAGALTWPVLAAAASVAILGWTIWALPSVKLADSDTAGLLSFGVGGIAAVSGGWALLISVRGLRLQQVEPVAAARELARLVHDAESREFTQLLGGERRSFHSINLRFTLHSRDHVEGAAQRGHLAEVVQYYRALRPGRLAVTGVAAAGSGQLPGGPPGEADRERDAGTGKTVLALALILSLTREQSGTSDGTPGPGRAPLEAVPVRLSAAAWGGREIGDWLKEHLRQVYARPAHVADALVDGHLVLPVIDGVDEMDESPLPGRSSRAAQLMEALDRYQRGTSPAPVVLTCRRPQYEALVSAGAQAQAVARVEIARVDPVWVRGFIRRRVGPGCLDHWQPVLDHLAEQPHGSLARALDTPWRLTLAITVFNQRHPDTGQLSRDPEDLIGLAGSGELYAFLLDRYIHAATRARVRREAGAAGADGTPRSSNQGHTPERIWCQLAVLAAYLQSNATEPPRRIANRALSSTDLVLHELWPLAGHVRLRFLHAAVVLFSMSLLPALILFGAALNGLQGFIVVLVAVLFLQEREWNVLRGRASWPTPTRVVVPRISARRIYVGLMMIAALALPIGFAVHALPTLLIQLGLSAEPAPGRDIGLMDAAQIGLGATLLTGVAVVFEKWGDLVADIDRTTSDPISPLRHTFLAGLSRCAHATAAGSALGYAFGILTEEPAGMLIAGFILGLLLGIRRGVAKGWSPVVQYLLLLLFTRGRLPWSLGRFLHWCYGAGLLRISGVAYQFRHRELQDHLASRPAPPPGI